MEKKSERPNMVKKRKTAWTEENYDVKENNDAKVKRETKPLDDETDEEVMSEKKTLKQSPPEGPPEYGEKPKKRIRRPNHSYLFVKCPKCPKQFRQHQLLQHLGKLGNCP